MHRFLFWAWDAAIHSSYCIVIALSKNVKPEWKKYSKSTNGRYTFQNDAAMKMVERGIIMDWEDFPNPDTKPKWVRQADLIPCSCNNCFWCIHNFTTGIGHKNKSRTARFTCSNKHEKIKKNKMPCLLCMKKYKEQYPNETYGQKADRSYKTVLGCKKCNKCICTKCWYMFSRTHNLNDCN